MLFANRFDKISLDNSVDDMKFKKLEYSYQGTKQTVDAEIDQLIDESRYIILEDMLFSVTDFDQTRTNTKITAIDFVHKLSETITVHAGTYTLLDLLKFVNDSASVQLTHSSMPQITIDDDTKLSEAIDDLVSQTNGFITIETRLNFTNVVLFNVFAYVIGLGVNSFQNVDTTVLIDDINTVKHFNPQLDLAKKIVFTIDNINDKSKLSSWSNYISGDDYQKIIDKIDGVEGAISDIEASNILVRAINFRRSIFNKSTGTNFIENIQAPIDDGIPYNIEQINFTTYNTTVNRVINTLFAEYKQVDYPPIVFDGDLRQFKIIGIDGNILYRSTELVFDVKKRITTSLTMLIGDFYETT